MITPGILEGYYIVEILIYDSNATNLNPLACCVYKIKTFNPSPVRFPIPLFIYSKNPQRAIYWSAKGLGKKKEETSETLPP